MHKKDYDSIVIGSGPNGLAAAITMQKAGLSVLLIEGKETIGGGMRSAELTLPGFVHDVCSAIHPMAVGSPFFKTLSLEKFGLKFIQPEIAAAHPFSNGQAAALYPSVEKTAETLGEDQQTYKKFITPFVERWSPLSADLLAPLHFPKSPGIMARFGLKGLPSATTVAKQFRTEKARGLWAGMAAHSMQPLTNLTSSAVALTLLTVGHANGWPLPQGGSQVIANALADCFASLGGTIQTNWYVRSLHELPSAHAVIFDVTPKQLLEIAGRNFSRFYQWQMKRYRYGMGVYKIDWALKGSIPFTAPECRKAATVHLGNTLEEIVASEKMAAKGQHSDQPFVLLAQQSLFDSTRVPDGKQSAWAYCHVPHNSEKDMTTIIEKQVERFAPGFRDLILECHTMNSSQMENYNPNYVGGDINGGLMDIRQLFTRPALRTSPYRTSAKGIYICSSATPPGGGVHGMSGYYAARRAMKDIFKMKAMDLS